MPRQKSPKQVTAKKKSGQETRTRILHAAILRFSQNSYDDTTLRDIAEDVGVDVAFVHRSFGSKEELFTEVIRTAFEPQNLFTGPAANLADRLTARLLEPSLDKALHLIDPLDVIVRSLLSPKAIPIIRESIAQDAVAPLAENLGNPSKQRAALIIACLAGISIFRHVLRTEALLEASDDDLAPLIKRMIGEVCGGQ